MRAAPGPASTVPFMPPALAPAITGSVRARPERCRQPCCLDWRCDRRNRCRPPCRFGACGGVGSGTGDQSQPAGVCQQAKLPRVWVGEGRRQFGLVVGGLWRATVAAASKGFRRDCRRWVARRIGSRSRRRQGPFGRRRLADVHANSRLQVGDRFRIGSVTKTFVATAVLQLVAENQSRLDEPVARLLPRLLADGERITIRDLLAHRSGLADVADNPAVLEGRRSNWSPQKLVKWASQQPRISAPGRAFHYSSTNYLVLGLVVERVTHQTLSAVLAHRIIAPLGLSNTSFEPAFITGPHVHGYQFPSHQGIVDARAVPRDLEKRSVRWAGAAGLLVSSAADPTINVHHP
jgi:hypothetical protein